ncbi:MAG: alpha/beta hydrolase family protein, partial [Gemmatimonadales bacterium]
MATVKKLQFELIGSDGAPLRGDVYTAGAGDRRPLVVVCHGFKGFKDWGFFPFLAQRLARAGMTAVSFNFSGSGVGEDGESFSEPQRFARNTYSRALRDLEIVRNAVQGGNLVNGLPAAQSCGLLGHSFGGAVSILFAAENSDVRALVTWAAVANPLRWDEQTVAQWREEGTIDIVNARTGEILPLYL